MNNQRGGIISKVFLVPAGALVVVVVFVLGYYPGRYQERKAAEGEKPPTLPELASQYLPKKEDLTFYKTLTERGEKTVSIDLKAKQKEEKTAEGTGASKTVDVKSESGGRQKQEKQIEIKIDRKSASLQKQTEKVKQPATKKETSVSSAGSSKMRYTVQIASYPDRALAEESMKGMKKKGYAAFVVSSELADKGTWYRVRLGSFSSKAAAEKLAKELQAKEGVTPFITVE